MQGHQTQRRLRKPAHAGRPPAGPGESLDQWIVVIAAKQLVARITGECHCDVAPGEPRHRHGREGRAVRERLVELVNVQREQTQQVTHTQRLHDVVHADVLGYRRRGGPFVVVRFRKRDGESLRSRDTNCFHGRNHVSAVDATGQKGSHRHVAHQP